MYLIYGIWRNICEKIVQIITRPFSIVKSVAKWHLLTTNFENCTRKGRSEKLARYDVCFLLRQIKIDPTLRAQKLKLLIKKEFCSQIVRSAFYEFDYNGRSARKKYFISEVNWKRRLAFAEKKGIYVRIYISECYQNDRNHLFLLKLLWIALEKVQRI